MRTAPIRLAVLSLLAALTALTAADDPKTNALPDFDEVRQLIHAHLAGATDQDLNRAAVEGLLHSLRGKVRLVSNADDADARTNPPAVGKAIVLDDHIGYLRIAHVSEALPGEVARQCETFADSKKIIGLVLDLRFAEGEDYEAVVAVADLFIAKEKPLLDWGKGIVKSLANDQALNWPVAVLVNGETTGAAEALAAVLREARVALILGSSTRGAAMTATDFPLQDGQRLRIATAPVKLGDGTPLSAQGVQPDIVVSATPEMERAYLADPYANVSRTNLTAAATNTLSATNRPARRMRVNEADLVRARREGLSLDGDVSVGHEVEPEKAVIRDPALARAVDLLKGLAIVRRSRP